MSLPKVEIPIFNGDPREYHMFISTFDQVMGNVLSSEQAKLTRLYQYLSGEARSAVKPFAQIGYAKARMVLRSIFVSSHLVAQCVIDDLRNGESAAKPTGYILVHLQSLMGSVRGEYSRLISLTFMSMI